MHENNTPSKYQAMWPTARPFPVEALPPVMQLFALEIARTICVDPVMAALPMISIAGACLGNAAWVQMSADYVAPPNIWSGVAARSGERKSPVLTAVMRPVYERQTELAEQHATTVAQYESAIRLWKKLSKRDRGDEPIEPPPFQHLYVADATTEAIAMRLHGVKPEELNGDPQSDLMITGIEALAAPEGNYRVMQTAMQTAGVTA